MNEEYIKIFVRMSGGRLFHSIEKAKHKDPSERVSLNPSKTREIFELGGLSAADYALWRDTEMLHGMSEIAYERWSNLNSKNLKIQAEFEDCISDNREQINWQDISLSWEEAEELAAEEYVKSKRFIQSHRQEIQKEERNKNIKILTWQEMKDEILNDSPGITNEAMRQATYRAIKKAHREKRQPPIPLLACFKGKGYAIQELCDEASVDGKSLVENCKYIRLEHPNST